MLGIYGGDDGITTHVEPDHYVKVAKMFGLTLKATTVQRGEQISFLARQFGPGVWNGDPTSCCSIKRQVTKFHITTDKLCPPVVKFGQKLCSIILTDHSTPIFAELAAASKRLGLIFPSVCTESWWGRFTSDVQFPNDPQIWMWEYMQRDLPGFNYERFEAHCARAQSIEELMNFPLCMHVPAPVPPPHVFLNGVGDGIVATPEPIVGFDHNIDKTNFSKEGTPAEIKPTETLVAPPESKNMKRKKEKKTHICNTDPSTQSSSSKKCGKCGGTNHDTQDCRTKPRKKKDMK